MRTLEEVRADLARLRETSKVRQAEADAQAKAQALARQQALAQRQADFESDMRFDTSFAPTDFMEVPHLEARAEARRDAPHTDFAPTDILEFAPAQAKPAVQPAARPLDKPAPAVVADDFLDFSALKPLAGR